MPKASKYSEPSWFGYPLTIKKSIKFKREEIIEFLNKKSIGTRLLFAGNIVRQPYMKNYKYKVFGTLKNSDAIMERTFWIGLYPGLNKSHLAYSIRNIEKFLKIQKLIN
tara:strand:- start:165 stop:491 length:327 start_codon:yes stop_codon:yes gene_type:complete